MQSERLKLLDRTGALQVGGGEERLAALAFQRQREFRGSRGFARPLQSAEHQHDGAVAALRDFVIDRPHQCDEFFVNDLDDLFGRIDAGEDVLADGFRLDFTDELGDDVEIHVGFEECPTDFAQTFANVVLGESPAPTQFFECIAQPARHTFKHASPSSRKVPRLGIRNRPNSCNIYNSTL